MIADTSGLIALADRASTAHGRAVQSATEAQGPFRVPITVLVEFDHLARRHRISTAFARLLAKLTSGDFELLAVGEAEVERAAAVLTRFSDLDLDFTDATIVALAERERDYEVLTLDERDFRALRPKGASRFRVLPADLHI